MKPWFFIVISAVTIAAARPQPPADEGAFVLAGIKVDGNKYYKDGQIRDFLRLDKGQKYDRYLFDYLLEKGLKATRDAYYAEGFEAAEVKWSFRDVKPASRKIQLKIKEGPRTEIADILIDGVAPEEYVAVRENLGVDVGSPLAESTASKAAAALSRYFAERGYARAKVEYAIDREAARLELDVDAGRAYYLHDVIVAGNERTRPRIITREFDYVFRHDRLYRTSRLDRVRGRIYATGLYRDLRLEPVEVPENPDWLNAVVVVREDKFKWYKAEPGFSSPDMAKLTLAWGHNNVFGNNQRLAVTGSVGYGFASEEVQYAGDITYTEPWLFGYRYEGLAKLFYERDYRGWEAGVQPQVTRELTEYLEVTGALKLSRARAAAEADRPAVENITSVIGSATYDRRNDLFIPLRGVYLYASEETAGGWLGGADFWRVIGDARQYLPVGPAATLATHLRAGISAPYGASKVIPATERFYCGGAYSVRGYAEDGIGPVGKDGKPYGGDLSAVANAELRFQLPFTADRRVPGIGLNLGNFWGGMFADAGTVWLDWDDFRKRPMSCGAGAGIRYNTPVGPVRFDYARPLTEGADLGGYFYFAFGNIF